MISANIYCNKKIKEYWNFVPDGIDHLGLGGLKRMSRRKKH
jgi:hypothetical protein